MLNTATPQREVSSGTVEFCHKCDSETLWETMRRGSKREQCVGCKDVYPCRSKCDHLDCQDEKASWVKAV